MNHKPLWSGFLDGQAGRRHPAASSTVLTCSLVTPGKSSKNTSRESPALKWSKRLLTGTRVPRKTGSPPSRAGSFSTHSARRRDAACASFSKVAAMRSLYAIGLPFGNSGDRPAVSRFTMNRVWSSAFTRAWDRLKAELQTKTGRYQSSGKISASEASRKKLFPSNQEC